MAMGKKVSFASAKGPADGWLVRPGSGRPGVIVLQEWWGIVPHIQDVTARFAAQGYVALAPDLYHGKTTVDAEEASHLMNDLDWGRALEEIAGAIRYLRDSEGVDRLGVAGFCMGGALTVLAATLPGVDAYAAFYGFPPAAAADLNRISAPGLIFFGEQENFFSIPDAQAFAEAQRRAGRETEVVVYPDAGHAFFNNDRPEAFNASARNESWRRTLELFGRHLRPNLGAS
jgi:carboxymethylenebutenolidase